MKNTFIALILLLATTSPALAENSVIFYGKPSKKIEIYEQESRVFILSPKEQEEYKVIISKRNGRYYWSSRDNVELELHTSGIYQTYVAKTGSGYVRVSNATAHHSNSEYSYSEHLILGFNSITYFGR